jgi:maleate isomerase
MTSTFRVGMVVPSSNVTMETEIPALMRMRERLRPQEEFTFHSARARMREVTPDELRNMNGQMERAGAELADLRPDVVATACLVAIMAQGPGYHCTVEDDLARTLAQEGAEGTPVVSSAGALIEALQAIGASQIAMVTPYRKPLTRAVADYIEDAGFAVHDAISLEVADNRAVAALDPADLHGHVRRLDLKGCDALVLSACVQMRSLPVIASVERSTGLPTLSAATATARSIVASLGLPTSIPDAGAAVAPELPPPTAEDLRSSLNQAYRVIGDRYLKNKAAESKRARKR